jgi:uncharacterized protein YbbC (DUF1343 family)
MSVLSGLDLFKSAHYKKYRGCRIGLLSNQASVTKDLIHAKDIIQGVSPGDLKALFGPQHGYAGEDQDNMIETGNAVDKEFRIPIFSLYSHLREPSSDMMALIDVLFIDMQDVGTRVYTFSSTMLNCMKAAKKHNVKIVVLDRPNPVGGVIMEGNILEPELYSFVGPFKIPMRHGMTMGELALMFNKELSVGCDLSVIRMEGWQRSMFWAETGLPWAVPSPNMPIPESAYIYPGQVIWEGTNLSEGRGTCRPFEIFGAPYLDTGMIKKMIPDEFLQGCFMREISFKPTFNKWQGEICKGFMIHIQNKEVLRSYDLTIAILKAVIEIHRDSFEWKNPPYEYEYKKLPIDLILGNYDLRVAVQEGRDIFEIRECWLKGYEEFKELRRPYLLYENR